MTQPAQSERVMDSTQSAGGWVKTTFPMRCFAGHGAPAKIIHAEGWVRGPFGIDERENHTALGEPRRGKVWCITHLPTGYAARYVIGSRAKAQSIADAIAAEADWNFTDPGESKHRGPAVKRVMLRFPQSFVDAFEAGTPVPVEPVS